MSGCKHKEVHGESETDPDPPVVSRTRSGRRVRPPAALLDSVAPASRTPVRRTRRSVVREDPGESAEPPLETPTADIKPEQCTTVADITTAEEDESSPQPVLDDVSLTGPDQTHEKENMVSNAEAGSTDPRAEKRTRSGSSEKKGKMVPLGKPKSGRVWKDRNKQRFSALLRDKPLRTSWQKKMEAKREKQLVKQYHQQLKDEQAKEKEDKKRRRAENLKRRAENERKAEIVQVIKNTAKIKRMKKKQLRKIEKRDTLSVLQKTPPSVKKGSGKTTSSL